MTTLELKSVLIHRIAAINDKTFLAAIKTIIETKSETEIYKTTPEQRHRIKEGQEQIARGEYYTNEQVEMEIDKWLKEK
jgi:predicted transcriptional regulator